MAERRVAPPAVGTVALACEHCHGAEAGHGAARLALLGPGRRLWWRHRGKTALIEGFTRATLWCAHCGRATMLGGESEDRPVMPETLLTLWWRAAPTERAAFLAAIGAMLR